MRNSPLLAALTLCAAIGCSGSGNDVANPGGNAGFGASGSAGRSGSAGAHSGGSAGTPSSGGSSGASTAGEAGEAGTGGAPSSDRIVYAWFPKDFNDWSWGAIDWTAITHLSFRAIELNGDGSIKVTRTSDQVKALVDEAHAHGVKVTVLVWGPSEAAGAAVLAKSSDQAVASLLDYVVSNGLDGINMDDETWAETNSVTGAPNRDLVTAFFAKLHDAFKAKTPEYHLSWASPPVIAESDKYGEAWVDYAAVAQEIDAFTVMAYELNPPTIGWTTAKQPLAGGGLVTGHARDLETLVSDYVSATGGAKATIVMGIDPGRGGVEWDAQTDQPLSPIIGAPRLLSPSEVLANADLHGRLFDPLQKTPWYRYSNAGAWVQGWYEDDESLGAKLDYFKAEQLGGVCVWVLDGSAEPAATFDLLRGYLQ